MAWYVQVVNGLVKNAWDSAPPVPVGEDGWRNAVQNIPEIDPQKQEYGDWTYDIEQDPVVISREVKLVSLADRKKSLLLNNDEKFKEFVDLLSKAPSLFDEAEILANKINAKDNRDAIEAATTHEELDTIVLKPITLF